MKYEKPEAEAVEFKTMEENALQGWYENSKEETSVFQLEGIAGPRDQSFLNK